MPNNQGSDKADVYIGFLNIVATPHPDGIYPETLKKISNRPINFYGNEYAVILRPKKSRSDPNLFEGVIRIWTDIDPDRPSINKRTFAEEGVDSELKKIFSVKGFNNRGFSYVLNEKSHHLAVELQSEIGQKISIRQFHKIFELALSRLNVEGQTFSVTIIPTEDAIESVLGLERLDRIKIYLKRPNPGDHDDGDAEEVLRELDEQNLKEADYSFSRQPGTEGIHLNSKNLLRAEVAAQNGHVESAGLNDDGQREKRSTKEYPKIVRRTLAAGVSFIRAIREEAQRISAEGTVLYSLLASIWRYSFHIALVIFLAGASYHRGISRIMESRSR
jgi:hypothetical protein